MSEIAAIVHGLFINLLGSVVELYTRQAYIIPAYRDLSTLWVSEDNYPYRTLWVMQ
jgi:hypothetical protein